jgi:hypothetical protein
MIFYHFSHWLYAWFILYYLRIVKFNPKIFILVGIIENIICYILLSKNLKHLKNLTLPIIEFIIKLFIFYNLRNTNYKMIDFIAGIILYIIYNILIKIIFNQNILEFYNSKINI